MSRTERWWGQRTLAEVTTLLCPLCRAPLYLVVWRDETMLPGHLTESLVTCSDSGKTLEAARELAALRLRAHP
jgi:uncharacterized protein YbaR (Trm112 family)